MDRDDRGKQLPSDSGSFDLSKRGATEVAAELAARMSRWREARKRQQDAPAQAGSGASAAAAARPARTDPVSMAREQDPERVARLHRALRVAAQAKALHTEAMRTTPAHKPAAYGTAFKEVLSPGHGDADTAQNAPQEPGGDRMPRGEHDAGSGPLRRSGRLSASMRDGGAVAWRAVIAALERGMDLAWERGRALGTTARRATADRLVIAAGIAIVLAAAVWLMQPHAPLPEQIAIGPEQKPPPAAVAAVIAPARDAPEPPPAPEAQASAAPPTPATPLPLKSSPKLKPTAQGPVLVARLKPAVPDTAAQTSPNSRVSQPPAALEAGPLRRQEQ